MTTENTVSLSPVAQAAKAFLLAKSAFNQEYTRHWHTLPVCSDAVGWALLGRLRDTVHVYVFSYERGAGAGIPQAAQELFRLVAVGQSPYSYTDLYGFVKWYGQLKRQLGKKLGKLFEFHGDSFGDLIDSLPLAGEAVLKPLLDKNLTPLVGDEDAGAGAQFVGNMVLDKCGLRWHKLICGDNENYVESTLERAAYHAFVVFEMLGNEEVFTTAEEQKAVQFCDMYDE